MGRVKDTFPLKVSDLKTAWGLTGTYSLRSFVPGGSYANTYTAAETGAWAPSGTLKISDLRGATNLNVTFSGSNTLFVVQAESADEGFASASSGINVYANGVIQLIANGNGTTSANPAALPSNSWLQRQYGDCSSTVGGMYEILWVKTGGSTGVTFTSNNLWQRLDTTRSQEVQASSSGSPDTVVVKGRMKFRRYSDGTELANVYCELYAFALANNQCPNCCLPPETLILMATGEWMAIVDVRVGDEIVTRSGNKKVTEIITRVNRVMYEITFADGRILRASEDHPIYVVGRGYAAVNPGVGGNYKDLGIPEQLYVGDFVLDADGKENEIVSIEEIDYPHMVYTFAESEFYANGMLVY